MYCEKWLGWVGNDQLSDEDKAVREAMDMIRSAPDQPHKLRRGFVGSGVSQSLISYIGKFTREARRKKQDNENYDATLQDVKAAFLLVVEAANCTWARPARGTGNELPRLTFIGKKAPKATVVTNKDDM